MYFLKKIKKRIIWVIIDTRIYRIYLSILNTRIYRYYDYLRLKRDRTLRLKNHYSNLSMEEYKKMDKKVFKAWMEHKIAYWEFYMLQLEDKTMNQISEYLSYYDLKLFCRSADSIRARKILGNKWKSYSFFSKYYGRRVLFITLNEIENGNGIEKLTNFVGKADSSYIIKPIYLSKGRGVKKLSSVNEIVDYVRIIKECVVEDVIVQDESMAVFNESSVNTLRINTINYGNGEVDVIWPCLRMGRLGCVVDNAGAGGIFSAIDVNTGKTIAAVDESHNVWKEHPDSKIELEGFAIPRWGEAVAFAKELAKNIPEAAFVGWDIALTNQGWVMVEGNAIPLIIYQMAVGRGILDEFNSMKKKYYLKQNGR